MLVNLSKKKKQYNEQKRNETIAYHVTVYSPDSGIVGNKSDGNPPKKNYICLFSLFFILLMGTICHPLYVNGERKREIFFYPAAGIVAVSRLIGLCVFKLSSSTLVPFPVPSTQNWYPC